MGWRTWNLVTPRRALNAWARLLSPAVIFALVAALWWMPNALAQHLTVIDGDTLILNGTKYRLDGIDAPEMDQVCLDDNGAEWKCGIAAREALEQFIAGRRCNARTKGPIRYIRAGDVSAFARSSGVSLNEWLVREGWALNYEPYARGRFRTHDADAEHDRRGMWKGCFAAPWDLRTWNKSKATLMGPTCGPTRMRAPIFFPDHADMPPDCPIIGNITWRARITSPRHLPHARLP